MTNKMSQTQLSNVMSVAGLLVILANQFGWILQQDKVAFILCAIWSLSWTGYNWVQRYKKGDLSLSGYRK